jgi:hypothetical protein
MLPILEQSAPEKCQPGVRYAKKVAAQPTRDAVTSQRTSTAAVGTKPLSHALHGET